MCARFHSCRLIRITHRGPSTDGLIVSHLPHGPTASFSLSNVVLRHDIEDRGTMSEALPHLIFHNFTTKIVRAPTARAFMYVFIYCYISGRALEDDPPALLSLPQA